MSAILKQKLIDIANGFTKYGLWKGGGSGGSSTLADMTDVSFSNLKENDLLKYNGSVWVNGNNLHEYSTEEKIVGKWIDGKDIYEKVISGTIIGSPSDWTDFYNCTDLNIDTMIEIKGFFNYRNQRSFMLNDRYSAFTYKYDTKIIQNYNTDLAGGLTFNVTAIIQYTKTV